MSLPERSVPAAPIALLVAVRRLLRPLVKLMLRCGVTFPVLADVLRCVFVDVALADILLLPETQSDSRISLITGIHRKEIKRLRAILIEPAMAPEPVTIGSQIIARWLGMPPFAKCGHPRPLPRMSDHRPGQLAAEPSFDALVASVTTDIRPRVVLDDWLSQALVRVNEAGLIELNTQAFVPRPGAHTQLFYFARNLHDHIAAAEANITAEGVAPFLDRSVHYDGLTPEQAGDLMKYAREAATRALLDVNRRALELIESVPTHATAATPMQQTLRVNMGIFVFSADDTAGAAPSASAKSRNGRANGRRAPNGPGGAA